MAYITHRVTLAAIRAAHPTHIYYSAGTCWWTHDPQHLYTHPSGLPCDPRGAPLYETADVEGFLAAAEAHPEHYGRHGIAAFLAAHHANCQVGASDARPTCLKTWEEYNAALDAQAPRRTPRPRRLRRLPRGHR
jgi:hypothetical protein